jgi:hypothetical protein
MLLIAAVISDIFAISPPFRFDSLSPFRRFQPAFAIFADFTL